MGHADSVGCRRAGIGVVVGLVFCGLVLVPVLEPSAHSGATGIVKERMDLMVALRQSMKRMIRMVNEEAPYEPSVIVEESALISSESRRMAGLFPEKSLGMHSEARPALWEDWSTFESLANTLAELAEELAEIAPSAEVTSARAQLVQVAKTCTACHSLYRKKLAH